jgi:hypothetical protein
LSAERSTGARASLVDILFGYAYRVTGQSVLGNGGSGRVALLGGPWAIAVLAAAVAVVLGVAVIRSPRRLVILAAAVASVAFFVITSLFALGLRYPPPGLVAGALTTGSRYTVVPTLLLLVALALAAQAFAEGWDGRRAVAVHAAAFVPLLLFALFDYQADRDVRGGTERWSEQVERAADVCRDAAAGEERILIAAPTEAWQVTIRCAELRDEG